MVRKKFKLIFPIFLLALTIFFFYFSKSQITYRNDCRKSLDNFDILFVYLQNCPHCKKDLERMHELGIENKFYMIDASNFKCREIIEKYADYIIYHKNSNLQNVPPGIFTPTKVCIHTNKTFIGEMTLREMKNFYEKCISEKK